MKNQPLYENLNTSFVNLPALINFLRRAGFAGSVSVKFRGYEAEIYFSARNKVQARENDRTNGRIAEGADVLRRILLRARAPGGIINVYQNISQSKIEAQIKEFGDREDFPGKLATAQIEFQGENRAANTKRAHLPFELSNRVENRARQTLSGEEFQELLSLTAELLETIDRALESAQLDFAAAFQKACAEIAADYPFLTALEYRRGQINLTQPASAKIFVAAVLEALRRILEKLAQNPKFIELYRDAAQNILTFLHRQRDDCDRFFLTPGLQRILGV